MIQEFGPWVVDLLLIAGLVGMTAAVFGMYWFPDLYTSLHAASKVMVIGIIPILISLLEIGDVQIASRALLIAAFLFLTSPISAHVLGRTAYLKKEAMETPDVVDESGRVKQASRRESGLDE